MNLRFFAPLLAAAVALTSCTTPLSEPPPSFGGADIPYRIRSGDTLLLEVFQEPYMTTRQKVAEDGTINVGLIGRTKVAGLTTTAAAERIAAALDQRHLVNPQVTLTVETYSPRRFVVWGQVRNPGTFVIPGEENVTLPMAIAMAGGNTDIGDLRKITVTRNTPTGQDRIRMSALGPGADAFVVREGDTIRVGETIF